MNKINEEGDSAANSTAPRKGDKRGKAETVIGFIQLIAVIAFIVASFVISGMLHTEKRNTLKNNSAQRVLFVETTNVTPQTRRIAFNATGNIKARANVNIVPEVSGRIQYVSADFYEGGLFQGNKPLFKIDPRDYELSVQRLSATVAQAKTALDLQRAEAQAAIEEWRVMNGKKKAPALVARAPQLAEAQANLDAAKAQLAEAQLDLSRATFTLPFSGRVLSSNLEQGQYVMAGQSYGSVFDLSSLEISASLDQQKLEWLTQTKDPQITAQIKINGKEETYPLRLKRSAASLDNGTRFGTIAFGFEAPPTNILPGNFARLHIEGPQRENITILPAAALQKGGEIWLVDANNQIHSLIPDILYAGDDSIMVTNINGPQTVVTSRLSGATEGMNVQTESGMNTDAANKGKDSATNNE